MKTDSHKSQGYHTDAVEAWSLNDGGISGIVKSELENGTDGTNRWGVWLNNHTFGRVLDFSCEGSQFIAKKTNADLSKDFSMSAWIMAPRREYGDRVIISNGTPNDKPIAYTNYLKIAIGEDAAKWKSGFYPIETHYDEDENPFFEMSGSSELAFNCNFNKPINITKYTESSAICVKVFIKDAGAVKFAQMDLTSYGNAQRDGFRWYLDTGSLHDGWNDIKMQFKYAQHEGGNGADDLRAINFFRIVFNYYPGIFTSATVKDLSFCKVNKIPEKTNWKLFLNKHGGRLSFEAGGISGLSGSGVGLVDGKWHHVMVSRSGDEFRYYVDGNHVKTLTVRNSIYSDSTDIYIGSDADGRQGFDGSIAEVRIYAAAKTPDSVTNTVIDPLDNEPAPPRLLLKKGITIDRRQLYQPVPMDFEKQTIHEQDIINCINMGFDHVKLLLTPTHLIDGNGNLVVENMEYIEKIVGYVLKYDFKCIVCLHPEVSWHNYKEKYLGNLKNFEILIKWFGEYAKHISKIWDCDHVAIQLMTEAAWNTSAVDWSYMSDRMWGAVRNVLPDHTIITSSIRWGNLEFLKQMSPATDPNLIYSCTTYEPYIIGWYYYGSVKQPGSFWGYIKDIPYPVLEDVDYTDAIENAIEMVPGNLKDEARKVMQIYVAGDYDGFPLWFNHYPSLYNKNWHRLRAASLKEWSDRYGGNIQIAVVEFGCMDGDSFRAIFGGVKDSGISDEKRIEYIEDVITAFEEYGIWWDYWSYNEAHTVFKPALRLNGASLMPEEAIKIFDVDLLTRGMGIKIPDKMIAFK